MFVTLYNAVSIDGFIATPNGNSEWVSEVDVPLFEKAIQEAGCIIVGRKTFEQYENEFYPIDGVLNIVMTSNPRENNNNPNVIFINKHPKEVIEIAKQKGFTKVLIVGGGKLNASFITENLIDEIIIDIHPIVLGKGIKIFESGELFLNFERDSVQSLDNSQVMIKYKRIN